MAFAIIFSITFILMLVFSVVRKNLHLFEIIFIWMIINILHHNYMTIMALNLNLFHVSDHPSNYWALVFIRIFLIPLLLIWYFNLTAPLSPGKRWMWLPLAIGVLIGVEFLVNEFGLIKKSHWSYWWSIVEWLVIYVLIYIPWSLFRNRLRKELNANVGPVS